MGSEMCIRDREAAAAAAGDPAVLDKPADPHLCADRRVPHPRVCCLLYTSDAADERSSVDLGGRRIIKKKNKEQGCRSGRG